MLICSWNLNNRVGYVPFRPEAAQAVAALDADVIVLNEFYPAGREAAFRQVLSDGGWTHQLMSPDTGAKANRVLIASRLPFQDSGMAHPDFDTQFPANVAAARFENGLTLVGLRIPAYTGADLPLTTKAWDWVQETAQRLVDQPAVIVGDLNTSVKATGRWARPQLAQMLAHGWRRAEPLDGPSYFGANGVQSEIDHLLFTRKCDVKEGRFVRRIGGYTLAGQADALSDHAALLCEVGVGTGGV
jgi:hypothetical protein